MTPRDFTMGVVHPAPGMPPRPTEHIGVTIGRAVSPPDTTGHSSFSTTLHAVAAGNPGAATAYINGYQHAVAEAMRLASESWDAAVLASGLRGPDLWTAFKDECGGDVTRFVALVQQLAAAGGVR